MQITEFLTRLSQHKRVLKEMQEMWAKFSFYKCFRNTGFCPHLWDLQNHPPFQFVCLSLVWVMTSLARFRYSSLGTVQFTLKKFENGPIASHFGFSCVWGKLGQGNHVIIVLASFSKSSVYKLFSVLTETKGQRFQIRLFWRAFPKSSFSWRIIVDGRPNRRKKAVFSNFSA